MAKKSTKSVATPTTKNAKAVVVVEAPTVELYEIPQSLPIQERSRNAVRRGLHKYLVEKELVGAKSTPANPKSISLTKPQMVEIETFTAGLIDAHFASQEYPETEIALAEGDGNIIFAKIDPTGDVQWVKSFAATQNAWNDGYCWPTGIISDTDGYSYLKGSHRDTAYFDNILLTNPYNQYSKFIAKINPDGNAVWAKSLNQHTSGYSYDYNQFDIDSEGNVYFGMQVRDTMDFGDDFQYIPIPIGRYDLFVAKYTTNGDLDWVKTMQGNETGYNWISSVAVYNTSSVFVGGFFNYYLSVDDVELTSNNKHGFVFMFNDAVGVKEVYNRNNKEFDIYPNPSTGLVTISSNFKLNTRIEILNVTGQTVKILNITSGNQQIDLSNLSKGLYFIKVTGDKYIKAEKLIIN